MPPKPGLFCFPDSKELSKTNEEVFNDLEVNVKGGFPLAKDGTIWAPKRINSNTNIQKISWIHKINQWSTLEVPRRTPVFKKASIYLFLSVYFILSIKGSTEPSVDYEAHRIYNNQNRYIQIEDWKDGQLTSYFWGVHTMTFSHFALYL